MESVSEKHFVLKFKLEIIMKKICAVALFVFGIGFGQESDDENKAKHRFVFEPDSMSLNIGEAGTVTVKFVDADGNLVQNPF